MPPRSTRAKAASAAAPAPAALPPAAKPIEEEKHADAERVLPLAPPPSAAPAAAATGPDSDPDADPCAICLEDLGLSGPEAAPIASLDRCVHRFHAACISDWAKVTNLCPLCKTRFKSIREIAHPLAAPPVRARAGLRDRAAKVVRVATKNQCVTFSSSDEEEEEEEEPAPRARRARRAAPEEEAEEEAAEPAPRARRARAAPARRAAPATAAAAPAASRSTRNRRRIADDETENDGDDRAPERSDAESEAKPDFSQMTDEEALAWALKESMVISTAEAEAANPARPAAGRAAAAGGARRARRAPAAAALAESKEAEEDSGAAAPAAPKPRGRRRVAAPDLEERKDSIEAADSDVAIKPASAVASNKVEWIRTRDGDWVRARTTAVTADSLMAQMRAQMAPVAAAAASSSAAASAASSSSSSSAAAASISKPRSTAMSQANEALDSFEQRILQRKQMQLQQQSESSQTTMPRLFSSAVIDLSAAIPAVAPAAPAAASSVLFSAPAPVAHSVSSSSSAAAHLCPPSPPSQLYAPRSRLSTTCDPERAGRGSLALIDAPGGLRIWKRRESGVPSQSQQQESKEELEQQQQEEQSSQESSQDSIVSGDDEDENMGDDENLAGDNGVGVPSLWSRVTSYFVNALTPSKAPEAFAAPGGPCMEGQKQPIVHSVNRQPLAARRLN